MDTDKITFYQVQQLTNRMNVLITKLDKFNDKLDKILVEMEKL